MIDIPVLSIGSIQTLSTASSPMAEFSASLLWPTPIVEVKYPDHAATRDALIRYCYESEARAKAAVASGVTPMKKVNLYESTFDFFQTQVPEVTALARFCAESVSRV